MVISVESKETNSATACRLCGKSAILQLSHIYPRFVFKWMAKTAAGALCHGEKPNRPIQDGTKLPLLCQECEQRFSPSENWFATNLFFPSVSGENLPQQYDQNLFYFIISLAWRMTCLPRNAGPPADLMENVDREWRHFLLNREIPKTYAAAHLILCNPDHKNKFGVKQLLSIHNFHRYFGRNTDGTLVGCQNNFLVYVKLPCFLFFVPITRLDEEKLINTRVSPEGGNLLNEQDVRDPWLISILEQRAAIVDNCFSNISERQTNKVLKKLLENPDSYWAKCFWSDVKETSNRVRHSRLSAQGQKVGRNEPCPCGSGKKLKHCCGSFL